MKTFLYKKMKQKSGAALLILLSMMALIIPLLQGLWLDTQLNYQFRRHTMNKLQARFNAQAGVDLSLLRLHIFKGIQKSLPKKWEAQFRPVLDSVWQFPFSWPLQSIEDMLESEKDNLQEINQNSIFRGSYFTKIEPEDGRLDINDLSSPLPFLRDFTYNTLLQVLVLGTKEDELLKDEYSESDFTEILNNLSDATDLDNESLNGGSEDLIEPGKIPLNRSFISVEEIKKTPKMNKTIYKILEPYISTYGGKALNINYTKQKILEAMGLPIDIVEQILLRTQKDSEYYSPFSSREEFCDFTKDQGFDSCQFLRDEYKSLDMLSFNAPMAFRIISTGSYRSKKLQLEAVLYDLSVATHYQKMIYEEQRRQKNLKDKPEKKPENLNISEKVKFDYSYEKYLVIMYVKEKN